MRRMTIICLLALTSTVMEAQEQTKNTVLVDGPIFMVAFSELEEDKKAKEKTVVWPSTENAWIKDFVWAKDVHAIGDEKMDVFNGPIISSWDDKALFTPMKWRLTEEEGETVLHCYMRMPADVVTNLWLASEETAITDMETGVQYRAKRSMPDCMRKHFGVKAKKGNVLDLRVYFPVLPPTVRDIAIYGVPNWGLRGDEKISIRTEKVSSFYRQTYDTLPQFHHPHLIKPANNYDKDNHETWAVYDDAHLIQPVKEGTMALWRTPDATYLAIAHEQNWMREYFGHNAGAMLVDPSGHQYKLKEVQDYSTGPIFWVEGYSGDFIATVLVFEPIPSRVSTITYIEPEGEPFNMWGASWKGEVKPNLDVNELRSRQPLFEYHPRVIVE